MAYDAAIAGAYSGRTGYDMYMYLRRDQQEDANNRSSYWWETRQRRNSDSLSYQLDNATWYANVNGAGWSGSINCDFRSVPNGGSRGMGSGYTGWISHDGNGYLNVGFACSHSPGGIFGVAEASGILYTDRLARTPGPPGAPYLYSLIPSENKARVILPASSDNGGATIDMYLVRASVNPNPENAPYQDLDLSPAQLFGDLTNLLPGTRYYMYGYAHNAMGWTRGPLGYFDTQSGARVGKGDIFQGAPVYVGKDGAFVAAELRVGKDGSYVLAG